MASAEFRKALKVLRIKYNLSQKQVANVAKMKQTDYSAFETGKKKLDLDSADKLSKEIWGVSYTEFVEFSKKAIDTENLPIATKKIIKDSTNTKLKDNTDLLATELDRLISEGHLNTPVTSKLLHEKMNKKLADKKSFEITGLLGKAPRNKEIIAIGKSGTQSIFIHKNYAEQFRKLSPEKLVELIVDEERKGTGKAINATR